MQGLFWTAVIVGLTFWAGSELSLPFPIFVAWKGLGVALLALWAALQAKGRDGWLLAGVLAFDAVGDVVLEAVGLQAGAAAFLFGHLLAIWLYLRHRVRDWSWPLSLMIPVVVGGSVWLPDDRAVAPSVGLYALVLAAMAVAASHSRFRGAALGAWLFVASDLLIFASLGPLRGSFVPALLVWPLYFGGQAIIAWDVSRRLGEKDRSRP
jgi:uncharacterized membrane protein YhhN